MISLVDNKKACARNGDHKVLVVGNGEVGSSLARVLSSARMQVQTYDILYAEKPDFTYGKPEIMHICFPYATGFAQEVKHYIETFMPEITVINSTVPVGTTRFIANLANADVVDSPVRGRHYDMDTHLKIYKKFVGALDESVGLRVVQHFFAAGMQSVLLGEPEVTEIGKLFETTYYAACIAVHQEFKRMCCLKGIDFIKAHNVWNDDENRGYKKIGVEYLARPTLQPNYIGGHCLMPNLKLLRELMQDSPLIDFIEESNARCKH